MSAHMDAEAALTDAVRRLPDTPGTAHTLGPATSGHRCNTCLADTAIAADVLRIDAGGTTAIAVFYTCPGCC